MKKENIYLVEMVYEKERKSDLLQMGVSSHEAEIVRKEKRIKKATGKKNKNKQKQTTSAPTRLWMLSMASELYSKVSVSSSDLWSNNVIIHLIKPTCLLQMLPPDFLLLTFNHNLFNYSEDVFWKQSTEDLRQWFPTCCTLEFPRELLKPQA